MLTVSILPVMLKTMSSEVPTVHLSEAMGAVTLMAPWIQKLELSLAVAGCTGSEAVMRTLQFTEDVVEGTVHG
jgi:hypothetical protein